MKTLQEVNEARSKLCKRMLTPGLNDIQKATIGGMLNALVWVADGVNQNTMLRMLSDEPMAPGKDPMPPLVRLNKKLKDIRDQQ